MTEPVRPVRRDRDLEDRVPHVRDGLHERVSRHSDSHGQDQDAFALFREAELRLRAQHALAHDTRDLATCDCHVLRGQVGAELREHDETTWIRHVRGAADDLLLAGSEVHRHEA